MFCLLLWGKKKMQEIPVMPFSAASQIIHNNQHGTSCLLWLHAKSPEILVPHCVVTHSDQGYELLASLSASGEFELSVAPCHFFVASRFDLNNQNSHKCVSKGFTICKVYKPLCPQIQIQNSWKHFWKEEAWKGRGRVQHPERKDIHKHKLIDFKVRFFRFKATFTSALQRQKLWIRILYQNYLTYKSVTQKFHSDLTSLRSS